MNKKIGDINWAALSKPDKVAAVQLLYQVIKAVADQSGEKIGTVIDQSLAGHFVGGTDYSSNMRRGNIRASHAKVMQAWLSAHYFEVAHDIAPDLFALHTPSAWEALILNHAIADSVTVIPLVTERGIAERSTDIDTDHPLIRLMQDYYFELDSDVSGYCVAFEGYRGDWHPLRLAADTRRMRVEVRQGPQPIPRDDKGRPITLVERSDKGDHQFVFVVSPNKDLPTHHLDIAKQHDQLELHIHVITVFFA